MNSKPIDELIQSCLQSLNETSYNREVTMAHKRRFTLLKSFMVIHSKDLYSEVIGEKVSSCPFLKQILYPVISLRVLNLL